MRQYTEAKIKKTYNDYVPAAGNDVNLSDSDDADYGSAAEELRAPETPPTSDAAITPRHTVPSADTPAAVEHGTESTTANDAAPVKKPLKRRNNNARGGKNSRKSAENTTEIVVANTVLLVKKTSKPRKPRPSATKKLCAGEQPNDGASPAATTKSRKRRIADDNDVVNGPKPKRTPRVRVPYEDVWKDDSKYSFGNYTYQVEITETVFATQRSPPSARPVYILQSSTPESACEHHQYVEAMRSCPSFLTIDVDAVGTATNVKLAKKKNGRVTMLLMPLVDRPIDANLISTLHLACARYNANAAVMLSHVLDAKTLQCAFEYQVPFNVRALIDRQTVAVEVLQHRR